MISRPVGNGWISLEKWCNLTDPPTDWAKALAYANPKSKRTGKMFDPRDVDRRSNQEIYVWFQAPTITGFGRPRLIPRPNPSGADLKPASHTSDGSPSSPSHGQATAAPLQSSARSSLHGSTGEGA